MNCLDLLPDDITEVINEKVHDAEIIERRKIRKEKKRIANQYKCCKKPLEKAYSAYNNISVLEL